MTADECLVETVVEDCGAGFLCVAYENWNVCQAIPDDCTVHIDCNFNYRSVTDAHPYHCEWASTCDDKNDCSTFQTCRQVENWKECKVGVNVCASDDDCPPDSFCDGVVAGVGSCRSRNQCSSDSDCDNGWGCESNGLYLVCVEDNPCTYHTDCGYGYRCVYAQPHNRCVLTSECNIDSECDDGRCAQGANWNICQVLEITCSGDGDCEYGYMCNMGADPSVCAYASTCQSDSDCGTNSTCEDQGNWKECEFDWNPTICTDDRDCEAGEYCDVGVVGAGTCKSYNECENDWDCDTDYVCESNGTFKQCVDGRNCQEHSDCELGYRCVPGTPRNTCEYANECVPVEEQNCWFDFQCQDGWTCNDGQCMPVYAGTCSEVEGDWTVLVSTCVLVPIGIGYEFVPEDGCNGKVVLRSSGTTNGTFEQTSTNNYDITLSLVYN